jgi:hypothetical protein
LQLPLSVYLSYAPFLSVLLSAAVIEIIYFFLQFATAFEDHYSLTFLFLQPAGQGIFDNFFFFFKSVFHKENTVTVTINGIYTRRHFHMLVII